MSNKVMLYTSTNENNKIRELVIIHIVLQLKW